MREGGREGGGEGGRSEGGRERGMKGETKGSREKGRLTASLGEQGREQHCSMSSASVPASMTFCALLLWQPAVMNYKV